MATKPKPIAPPNPGNKTDWIVPALAVSMVFVMLIPLPALMVDLLLAVSITSAADSQTSAIFSFPQLIAFAHAIPVVAGPC